MLVTHTQIALIERAFEKVFDPEIFQDHTLEYYHCRYFVDVLKISLLFPNINIKEILRNNREHYTEVVYSVKASIKVLPNSEYADDKALIIFYCNTMCRKMGVIHHYSSSLCSLPSEEPAQSLLTVIA